VTNESERHKLERECCAVEEFLVRFPREESFAVGDVAVKLECDLFAERARAIRKALRIGLAEMAKQIP
jgi:hypothetical protein